MGDVFFDLACLAWVCDEKAQRHMLEIYFGECNNYLYKRLIDFSFIVQMWNASWAFVKSIDAKNDYDYLGGGLDAFKVLNNWVNLYPNS